MKSLQLILSDIRYFAPVWVFSSLNILLGTWALYIPYVKKQLAIDHSQIGIALFFYAFGILVFLPFIPFLSQKIGLGKFTIISIILFALSFILLFLADNYSFLCGCLFLTGIFSGCTDIAMNTLVSEIEKLDACNFMSAAHGFFSLGGVLGASIGSLFLTWSVSPLVHVLLISMMIILTNVLMAKHYYSIREKQKVKEKSSYHLGKLKPLIGLAFLAFVIMSSEGAIENWSNLYYLEIVQLTAENMAGIGFIAFSITMTIGRFFGDKISERFGSSKIIYSGCLIALFGYVFVLYQSLLVTTIGFGILGLGFSVIVPELFRLAGKAKTVSASVGISFVSGIGFLGFLIGPILLGLISEYSNLKTSFVCLLMMVVVALMVTTIQFRNKGKQME